MAYRLKDTSDNTFIYEFQVASGHIDLAPFHTEIISFSQYGDVATYKLLYVCMDVYLSYYFSVAVFWS